MRMDSKIALVFGSGQVARALYQAKIPGWKVVLVPHSAVDIRSTESVRSVVGKERCSIIINAAAFTNVENAEISSDECYAVNSDGPANIAIAAAAYNLPMLHLSTDYVFDGGKSGNYTELDLPNPKNVYGSSKFSGERRVQELIDRYIILRTSWVFSLEGTNFLNKMLSSLSLHQEVRVVGDQIGCPTPAISIAEVLLGISEGIVGGRNEWGLYHYCGVPQTSWYGFAEKIFLDAEKRGIKVPRLTQISTSEYKSLVDRPQQVVMGCTKIKDIWGIEQPDWRPRVHEFLEMKWPKGNLEQ